MIFKMLIPLVCLLAHSSTLADGHGLPAHCKKQFNQIYCEQPGYGYPTNQINGFIDDNRALMRRMYGSLVQEAPPPPPPTKAPKTPASTTFVRSVRQFGGNSRFSRSVDEGFLEDFLIEDELYSENDLDTDFSSANFTFELHFGREKRQAGFPGNHGKNDNNRVDACESRTEVTQPYWATNNNGQVRAVVNTKHFMQAVHQEICSSSLTIRCAGDCQCEQKYKWHRLLAYDPNNDCSGVFMDWFLFPSCCACRCLKNPLLQK